MAFVDRFKSFWNRRAIERAHQIAFTNFVLAELRVPLKVEYELPVKWWYSGAINGAGFKCESSHCLVEVSCAQAVHQPFQIRAQSYPVTFGITGSRVDFKELITLIETAETNYAAFVQATDSDFLHWIRRIVIDVWFTTELHQQNVILEEILMRLTTTLDGSSWSSCSPLHFESIGQWVGTAELVFPEPVPEAAIIERFRKIAPKFTGPLAGQVVDISNYSRKEIDLPGVCTMKLLARQF